jgi:hypothetical protein
VIIVKFGYPVDASLTFSKAIKNIIININRTRSFVLFGFNKRLIFQRVPLLADLIPHTYGGRLPPMASQE